MRIGLGIVEDDEVVTMRLEDNSGDFEWME